MQGVKRIGCRHPGAPLLDNPSTRLRGLVLKDCIVGAAVERVLTSRLSVMMGLRHRAPVAPVPEEPHVTTVRDDVIHHGRWGEPTIGSTVLAFTVRMGSEVYLARLLPCPRVATLTGTPALLFHLTLMFGAVTARCQMRAALVTARTLCPVRTHCCSSVQSGKGRQRRGGGATLPSANDGGAAATRPRTRPHLRIASASNAARCRSSRSRYRSTSFA